MSEHEIEKEQPRVGEQPPEAPAQKAERIASEAQAAAPETREPVRLPRHFGFEDERSLLSGPRSRLSEAARVLRIAKEFVMGFRALHFVGPCVTVFGSARFKEDHEYYRLGVETGAHLAEAGFTVMTGGGPGIMEAANRGAKEVGGRSIGCNIELPFEQEPNPYVDRFLEFRYFFVRKVMLVKYSYAFVALPGGFGTMDEVFETVTLIQTGKIEKFPIVLIGSEFWGPLYTFMRERLESVGTISPGDIDLLRLTDSPEDAVRHIVSVVRERFVQQAEPAPRPSRLLGEKEIAGAREDCGRVGMTV